MAIGIQIESSGKVEITSDGKVVVADATAKCCCATSGLPPKYCWYEFEIKYDCCDIPPGWIGTPVQIAGPVCQTDPPGPTGWTLVGYEACSPDADGGPNQIYRIWVSGDNCDTVECPGSPDSPPSVPDFSPTCDCPCALSDGSERTYQMDVSRVFFSADGGSGAAADNFWASPGDWANVYGIGGCEAPCSATVISQIITLTNCAVRSGGSISCTSPGTCPIYLPKVVYNACDGTLRDEKAPYVSGTTQDYNVKIYDPTDCILDAGFTGDCIDAIAVVADQSAALQWQGYGVGEMNCRWVLSFLGQLYLGPHTPGDATGEYTLATGYGGSGGCGLGGSGTITGTISIS